jgi:hypothetical protein
MVIFGTIFGSGFQMETKWQTIPKLKEFVWFANGKN